MKMMSTKMLIFMGMGIMGYMYLKSHPETLKSMKKLTKNMKKDMDEMMDDCCEE